MVVAGVRTEGDVVDQSMSGELKSPHNTIDWFGDTAEHTEEDKASSLDKGALGH